METKGVTQNEEKESGYGVMPVEYFLRYKGQCYDVGTRLRFKIVSFGSPEEGTIEWFSHNKVCIRLTDGSQHLLSTMWPLDNTIVEIIEPVYYEEPTVEYKRGLKGGVCPPEDDVFVGWVWYIVIMLVGIIFKDRFTIWVVATAVFFLWKNGFLNGGKK